MKRVINDELSENLEILGLNLEKIPKFIKDANIPSFNTSRINNDKDLKVYKFVPIDEIEILFTPCLRSDDIKEKYSEAVPLKFFLNMDGDEEEVALFKTFSKIVRNMSVKEIKKIQKMQEELSGKEPFKVKYNRDHLWQIYYSEQSKKYFMLVCTKEQTFSEFLYLLKAQLDFSKKRKKDSPRIYVPINCIGYSEEILGKSEISDLENYLWLFTKNWPLIFEVYNDKNEVSLQIVGETYVYKNIKSNYKVVLNSQEEAIKFYKLLKALFILQTEIKDQYKFETRIDTDNSLAMYLSKVEITFDSLTNFIKNEFLLADYEIKNQNKKVIETEQKLEELKTQVKDKEDEYLQKQKEISTYLECKKTFIGKVKYFFKSGKKEKKSKIKQDFENIEKNDIQEINTTPIKTLVGDKEFYTIEDLVTIYSLYERGEKKYKDVKQDLKALELKFENLNSKVRNANQYIEEIDKHKKSIFEFWKFANKDEKLALEMAEDDEDTEKNTITKAFDIDSDFEKLGEDADNLQRKKLSNEENDSIFVAQTELLDLINKLRDSTISKEDIEERLNDLKDEFNDDRLVVSSETFDIFGNITENNNKVKYIGSKSHRETEKDKFRIMNINKKIDVFDFTEKLQSILNYLEGAVPKINSLCDLTLYKLVPIYKNINQKDFEIFNINVENELGDYEQNDEGAYNLICLNYKADMPLLYYTNAMFYDNLNKTLPIGMNLSSKVLIDSARIEFLLVNKTKFRTNSYFNEANSSTLKSKDIFVYEYDVFIKDENSETSRNKLIPNIEIIEEDKKEDEILQELEELDETEVVDTVNENEEISEDIDNLDVNIDEFEQDENNEYSEYDDSEEYIGDESEEEYNEEEYIEYEDDEEYSDDEYIDEDEDFDSGLYNLYYDDENQYEPEEEYYEEEIEEVEEQFTTKSKKLLKLQQKYEKEMEKQRKKEEKAKKKGKREK